MHCLNQERKVKVWQHLYLQKWSVVLFESAVQLKIFLKTRINTSNIHSASIIRGCDTNWVNTVIIFMPTTNGKSTIIKERVPNSSIGHQKWPLASLEFTGGVLTYFGFLKLTFKGLYCTQSHHLLSVDSLNQHLYHNHKCTIKTCGCHFWWPILELDTLSFIMYSC